MSSAHALPFITLTDNQVRVGEWYPVDKENIATQTDSAQSGMPDWSYDSVFRIGREVKIVADECLKKIGLKDAEALLKLTILLEVGQPGIRHCVYSKKLLTGDVLDDFIVIDCPGSSVSENVKISTIVTLGKKYRHGQPFTPTYSGSRLWEEKCVIPLEGQGSRFPIRTTSFRNMLRVPDNADWFLEWSPEIADHAFAGSVLLYVNSDNKMFSALVAGGDEVVLSRFKTDIALEICIGMLNNKDFREIEENYEEGSVGFVASSWLEMAFPQKSRKELYQLLKERTSEFFSTVRAAFM